MLAEQVRASGGRPFLFRWPKRGVEALRYCLETYGNSFVIVNRPTNLSLTEDLQVPADLKSLAAERSVSIIVTACTNQKFSAGTAAEDPLSTMYRSNALRCLIDGAGFLQRDRDGSCFLHYQRSGEHVNTVGPLFSVGSARRPEVVHVFIEQQGPEQFLTLSPQQTVTQPTHKKVGCAGLLVALATLLFVIVMSGAGLFS